MDDETTSEEQRLINLQQARLADEKSAQTQAAAKPESRRFINSGEAIFLLAFTGIVEAIQMVLDFIPFLGLALNAVIAFFVGFVLYIWVKGKIAKGAPKKWQTALFAGAGGSILPFVPGYLGAIIWLILEDRQLLKKAFGKVGEMAQKLSVKL
ncbi:MAG: hypothetical protein A3A10_02510 [Candidatus Tagabacteria bacterium RIFCSPLOWO2_01_FULL_42_9]|uniref:Uncharacterized protein n=1 Tax=Candidatus Tagabacteria bacterium RIFCSPLOWO2_01_FULL_42_9 TaxID=1802296 RepID=A0A1G2LWW7_9BACT|nr:MAG: hypothetical protein A3A10_02510 [Candidatus Tagabacteria bacterium RIFCSPLOWO2_01_FULL_42_9]